ncbi:hypothetical protein JW968_05355 [Candidatus Woesearchaeota archaeon]|nr:hypothetical protein [Candidatus Woesearchaeota archaeon]
MGSKGVEMTMQTIIIAAILLIVLIVLIIIFTNSTGIFREEISSCSAKNGQCRSGCFAGEISIYAGDCPDKQRCCINITNPTGADKGGQS